MQLILYRAFAASVITLIIAIWFYTVVAHQQQHVILLVALLFLFMLVTQILLLRKQVSERRQWLYGYLGDVLLAALLIYATGGVVSPFSLLLGLIIIAAGTHAWRLLPMLVTAVASVAYLIAVLSRGVLDQQQSLHVLLQFSTLLLVGGVMAYIARRHATLRSSSDKAVRQHRQLKDLHNRIMFSMREGVIVLDHRFELSDMNDAARAFLGEITVQTLISRPELADYFQRSEQPTFQCECELQDKVMLVAVTRLSEEQDEAWLLTLVDISEIRRLESKLIQKEKMAALGQMAAMLAHEIRNPIHTITQGLSLVGAATNSSINLQAILQDEMSRLNRLVTTMLDYSRPMNPNPVDADIRVVVTAAIHQAESVNKTLIHSICEIDRLYVDVDHFRIVLDNLLSNALHHSPDDTAIQLSLTENNQCWQLLVCNQGVVPEEMREKIFEPFVSGHARGVGLGLATAHQACAVNGWTIHLIASEKEETCFCVQGQISDMQRDCVSEEAGHG